MHRFLSPHFGWLGCSFGVRLVLVLLLMSPAWASVLELTPEEQAWLDGQAKIVLGISDQFRPDIFVHPDGSQSGLIVDYFALLNAQLGNRLHLHVESNWGAVTEKAVRGQIDGLAVSAPNPVWDQHFLYSRPFYHGYFHVYVRAGALPLKGLADLAGKRVGYLAGMKVVERLVAEVPDVELQALANFEAMVDALLEGRVEAVIGAIDLEWWRRHNSIMGFEISGFIESSRHPVLMSIRKDWPLLPGILNKAMAAIPATERERIKARWLTMHADGIRGSVLPLTEAERDFLDGLRLRRAVLAGWRPLAFVDAGEQAVGIAEDYWSLIQDKLQLQSQAMEPASYLSVVDDLQQGVADLVVGATATSDSTGKLLLSDSFESYPIAIVMRRSRNFIASLSALEGRRVVVAEQGGVHALLKARYPTIEYLPVADAQAALDLVDEGKAMVAVGILPVLQQEMAVRKDNRLHLVGVTDFQVDLQIMLAPRLAALLPLLNRTLAAISPEERLNIHKKWMLREVLTQERIDLVFLWKMSLTALVLILAILLWMRKLSREVQSRRLAEQQLQETGERLRSILASLDDLVFVLDTEQRIIDVYYRDAERLLMPADDFLGKTCREVLPDDIYQPLDRAVQAVRAGGTQGFEYRLSLPSGERWFLSSISARFDGAGGFIGSTLVARDVTEKKLAEQGLLRSLKYQRTVADASLCLLEQGDYQDNLNAALRHLRECTDTARVYVFENFIDNEGRLCTRQSYEACAPGVASELDNPDLHHVVYAEGFQRWVDCLRRDEVLSGLVAGFPSGEREILEMHGIQSILVVPIQVQGAWWGMIGFDETRYARHWFDDEITMLKMAATIIGRYLALVLLQQELEAAKRDAEAASQAKNAFLANMSHELRTPLNAVLGYAQVLKRDPALGDSQRQQVDIIWRSGDHLLTLINDVLDIARIEAGRFELVPVVCQLPGLLHELDELFALQASNKGIRFICQTEGLPGWVRIDALRLRQICVNLLGNALKFTERGEVRLRASYRDSADAQDGFDGELLIEISDTGIGIPREQQQAVFQPFYQVGDRYTRHGVGLGLSICRTLVELMGGRIGLTSEPGQGSIFSLLLPIRLAAEDSAGTESIDIGQVRGYQRSDGRTQPFHVLVADDESINRNLVQELLQPLGFKITAAEGGEQALALCQQQPFDLVLMDRFMPGLDGLAAMRAIRESMQAAAPPIIGLSTRAFEEDRAQCQAAGCSDFLSKPLRQEALLELLQKHLCLRWLLRERGNPPGAEAYRQDDDLAKTNGLTTPWLDALEQAMVRGKPDQAQSLLDRLSGPEAAPVARLRQWIERYDYQKVLDWIEQCR